MQIKAYAKVNLILNVLGTRPDGYHEVRMLMQAISLADLVTVEFTEPSACSAGGQTGLSGCANGQLLSPADFEYGESDLAWRAALLMAQTFRPELIEEKPFSPEAAAEPKRSERTSIRGVSVSIEKHIPAAAGLAGGSSDAAAVMIGLAKLWCLAEKPDTSMFPDPTEADTDASNAATQRSLLDLLLPLGAKLGSDVPFCIAANMGQTAAIATGTGIQLQFVEPLDCGIELHFADRTIPNKTRAVYAELTDADCRPVYDIEAFLTAGTLAEKRRLMGNHLQAPAERLMERFGIAKPAAAQPGNHATQQSCSQATQQPGSPSSPQLLLCGAGPTYFSIGENGTYRTVTRADF